MDVPVDHRARIDFVDLDQVASEGIVSTINSSREDSNSPVTSKR